MLKVCFWGTINISLFVWSSWVVRHSKWCDSLVWNYLLFLTNEISIEFALKNQIVFLCLYLMFDINNVFMCIVSSVTECNPRLNIFCSTSKHYIHYIQLFYCILCKYDYIVIHRLPTVANVYTKFQKKLSVYWTRLTICYDIRLALTLFWAPSLKSTY